MIDAHSWRFKLFNAGVIILATSIVFYVIALVWVPQVGPINAEIRLGTRFFVIGTILDLLAFVFVQFGNGWKRVFPALGALVSIFYWYGFTLY